MTLRSPAARARRRALTPAATRAAAKPATPLTNDDTTGPANMHGMRPFMTNQIIADGKEHELKSDLRKFKPDFGDLLSRLDCNRSPTLIRLALAILCGNVWSPARCLQPIFTRRDVQK